MIWDFCLLVNGFVGAIIISLTSGLNIFGHARNASALEEWVMLDSE